ncbi:MAG: rubrerythrin family protein [Bacteroidales bacterium]|nr:rubrerythrin family protein [Bacteroidales bacterium]
MTIIGSQTEKNLLSAFANESVSRNTYLFFADKAKKEKLITIANIFNDTADHELSHAKTFFKFLEGTNVSIQSKFSIKPIASTLENLKLAAADEHTEWTNTYLHFAEVAKEEGFSAVAAKFKLIASVEEQHERRFLQFISRLETKTLYKREVEIQWKCLKCGFVHTGTFAPEVCAACNHPQGYFSPIEPAY